METYRETVGRYRVMRHTELPDYYKAEYRAAGIDPDDNWALIWSFNDEAAAAKKLAELVAKAPSIWTFKLVDAGGPETIERPVY